MAFPPKSIGLPTIQLEKPTDGYKIVAGSKQSSCLGSRLCCASQDRKALLCTGQALCAYQVLYGPSGHIGTGCDIPQESLILNCP